MCVGSPLCPWFWSSRTLLCPVGTVASQCVVCYRFCLPWRETLKGVPGLAGAFLVWHVADVLLLCLWSPKLWLPGHMVAA